MYYAISIGPLLLVRHWIIAKLENLMKNPLSKFLLFDERSDGIYVKATAQGIEAFDFDQCIRELEEAMVTNYDPVKIQDAVSRGRGQFEKIGPPFRYYNPEWDHHIDTFISPLKATVIIKSDCAQAGLTPDVDSIKFHLKRKNVVYGIKSDRLKKLVDEAKLDVEETVAEGDPPVCGVDAIVTIQLNTIPSEKPKILRDGRVDFRSIETFIPVELGQCIAKKIPATPGKAGKSVMGEYIATTPGKDRVLPQGLNTLISQDGLCLVAGKSGKIYEEHGLYHIQELMEIFGDVDYSIGNIKFGGDVLIHGNVLPGFIIEADGNITVRGEVEAAKIISRKGYITIEKGVIGKGCTTISGYLGIHLSFAQEAVITTTGPLSVDKFLLHCTCSCPILETTTVPASIVGKSIQISDHINVYQLGNENSVATEIQLIDKNKNSAQNKLKTLVSLEAAIKEKLDQILKQLRSKTAILKKAAFVTIQQKQDMEKLALLHDDMRSKLVYVQKNIEDMKFFINSTVKYDGYIQINGGIFPGVTLDLYGIKTPIIDRMSNKKFSVSDNVVLTEK
jgi:uncharacterized protein (DUF342 family)